MTAWLGSYPAIYSTNLSETVVNIAPAFCNSAAVGAPSLEDEVGNPPHRDPDEGGTTLACSSDADWREDLSRDRPLGYSWRLPSVEVAARLDLPRMPTKDGQDVLEAITADAILSARLYPGRRISYSRRAAHWASRVRYTGPGFNRDNVVLAVEILVEKGILIDHDRRPSGTRGRQSSYLPHPILAEMEMPKLSDQKREVIILKDAQGNLAEYKDTVETRDKRYMLCKVNDVLARTDFRIDLPGILNEGRWLRIDDYLVFPDNKTLRRIFNGGWTLGGRFYGGFWQNMRQEDRRHILIDGSETVEIDYDQLHARIIYSEANKKLRGDAYEIEGWERKVAKRAFFIIVNAKNFTDAKGALAELLTEVRLDPNLASKLIEAIKRRHHDVSDFFHSGCGLRLQNIDGKMAEHVLRIMTIRKGIACLPIHDSFIVPVAAKEMLVTAMNEAYGRLIEKTSESVCSVKYFSSVSVEKSATCPPQVHTYGSAPSVVPPLATSYHVGSGSMIQDPDVSTIVHSEAPDVLETQSEQPVRLGMPPMPRFLREAHDQAVKEWKEEQVRKQARLNRRQSDRQIQVRTKDVSSVVPLA